MSNKKASKRRIFDERVSMYLCEFSKESPDVRDSIVNNLPAYNTLLSLKASSFEEFALQLWAEENNLDYTKETLPLPNCPYCGSNKKVGTKGKGMYRCNTCNHSFAANYKSIASGSKVDALTWMKVLRCLLDFAGMTKTCEYCSITNSTYYNIRNRLFYAMQVLLDDLKLYGIIQVDNTFVRSSYKGMNLQESQFDEDSIFFDATFKPRAARNRGGAYNHLELNANSICIFTAIDDSGHVLTRFTGIGAANYKTLKHYVPENKYLKTVPSKDPFLYHKKQKKEQISLPEECSIIIADKEKAIEKYAHGIGMDIETHVFRRNGKQIRLSENSYDIQRVNALHKRLKEFLQKHHYVSTKYLPGYLILFEFIENTGASDGAIRKLFQILSKPNFDKPSGFFEELYTMPNYLEEWLIDDNPLNKFPHSKLLAFYMYDCKKQSKEYQGKNISMRDIVDETGYTEKTIRKYYREFVNAGYRDLILSYFEKITKTKKKITKTEIAPKTINPIVLAIYDEYVKIKELPLGKRPTFEQFLEQKNKEYGTEYNRTNMYAKFKYIETHNIREPLKPEPQTKKEKYGPKSIQKGFEFFQEYEKILLSYREKGLPLPRRLHILKQIGDKFGFSPNTVELYMCHARKKEKT